MFKQLFCIFLLFGFSSSSHSGFLTEEFKEFKKGIKNLKEDAKGIAEEIRTGNYIEEPRVYFKIMGMTKNIVGDRKEQILSKAKDVLDRDGKFEIIHEDEMQEKLKRYFKGTGYKDSDPLQNHRRALLGGDHGVLFLKILYVQYKATGSLAHFNLHVKAKIKMQFRFKDRFDNKRIETTKSIKYEADTNQIQNIIDKELSKTKLRQIVFGKVIVKAMREILPEIPRP